MGSPLEVYDRPANKFVAGFIGSPAMNFVEGVASAQGIAVGDATLALPTHAAPKQGSKLWLGIRPEHLVLDPNGLPARVEVVEPLGNGTMLHLSVFGTRWVVSDSGRTAVKAGDNVGLRIDPSRLHLFDTETETRLA